MNYHERKNIRLQYSVRAVIAALEYFQDKDPTKHTKKAILIPSVVRRAESMMDDEYTVVMDEEVIPVPDMKFILSNWKDICLLAAKDHKKYIIWDFNGIWLGTFQEYEEINGKKISPIVQGFADTAEDRRKIITRQGGNTISIGISIKQLEAGIETTE
jgi:hypothetical protein